MDPNRIHADALKRERALSTATTSRRLACCRRSTSSCSPSSPRARSRGSSDCRSAHGARDDWPEAPHRRLRPRRAAREPAARALERRHRRGRVRAARRARRAARRARLLLAGRAALCGRAADLHGPRGGRGRGARRRRRAARGIRSLLSGPRGDVFAGGHAARPGVARGRDRARRRARARARARRASARAAAARGACAALHARRVAAALAAVAGVLPPGGERRAFGARLVARRGGEPGLPLGALGVAYLRASQKRRTRCSRSARGRRRCGDAARGERKRRGPTLRRSRARCARSCCGRAAVLCAAHGVCVVGTDAVNRVVHATVADFRLETSGFPRRSTASKSPGGDSNNAGSGAAASACAQRDQPHGRRVRRGLARVRARACLREMD